MYSQSGRRGRRRAALISVPLAGLLVLTACGFGSESSGSSEGDGTGIAVNEADRQEGGGAADSEAAAQEAAADDPAPVSAPGQHLVRTADLSVATEEVTEQYGEAVRLTQSHDGYISSENTGQDADGRVTTTVTLKVPVDRYEELLSELAELGDLRFRAVATEDVTEEVVDVESRIASQQASVDRIRALMEEADSIRDIVGIESELSTRQAELESLQSRYESLRDRTALATINLELREPEADDGDDSDRPSVLDALANGWGAFVTMLLWGAAVLSAALPFLALLALILLVGRLVTRRRPAGPSAPPNGEDG